MKATGGRASIRPLKDGRCALVARGSGGALLKFSGGREDCMALLESFRERRGETPLVDLSAAKVMPGQTSIMDFL